ncbi:LysE family translocator [Octadecabacter sp. 1_MG-2023]|uniref:LysE family translocator n=1 Tax=unclassified Octadecabacter TaxID=196158 RepID=UPI001C084CDA|nr:MULTISPECIES: LysE family translocator [unclassified Octadecabacter]MBU2991962.1 LysE family translocator [Octadecabacter sp. B2R22]MDO6735936.1 LysE family translocator [Octadecabacter sp. 1_MG-2023]
MDLSLWMTFVAATVVLLIIPGPTIVLVLTYALTQGRRVAVASAAGVALGDFIAMTTSLVGLGALVLASATLFTALKWIGAAYLVWMGIGMIRSAGGATLGKIENAPRLSAGAVFRNATIVTALNPKSIAFFIAFVPQFIRPEAALLPQFSILIATFVGLAALNVVIYAVLADRLRSTIRKPAVLGWMTRIGGGVLIAMGVLTATLRKAA